MFLVSIFGYLRFVHLYISPNLIMPTLTVRDSIWHFIYWINFPQWQYVQVVLQQNTFDPCRDGLENWKVTSIIFYVTTGMFYIEVRYKSDVRWWNLGDQIFWFVMSVLLRFRHRNKWISTISTGFVVKKIVSTQLRGLYVLIDRNFQDR